MELQEVLGYYNKYEIPNIPFPFKIADKVLLLLASSSKEIFQWINILVTSWSLYSHFSLTSGLMYFQNPLKFLSSQWFFNLQDLFISLDHGMFLDPCALIWFLNHWNCWLLHFLLLNHWNLDFLFLNCELLSGNLYWWIKNWFWVHRHEIHGLLHLGFLGDNLLWCIKDWCSKPNF